MEIDHVSFSKIGGAGLVAGILASSQTAEGHSARLLTSLDRDLYQQPFSYPLITLAATMDKYLVQSETSGTQFSHLRSRLDVGFRDQLRAHSVVNLHWTSGVILTSSVKSLLTMGRKIVWTLHDMNPFTGGCHYSGLCQGFTTDCSHCPQARPKFHKNITLEHSKKILPERLPNLAIITPSEWLRNQALSSSVFKMQNILTIRNPISPTFFSNRNHNVLRMKMGFDSDTFVAICAASNLSSPNKNIRLAVESLEKIASGISRKLVLLLAGQQGRAFKSSEITILCLGSLDASKLADAYAASDLLLSTSKLESAGMTVVEAAACGTPCLVLGNGGGEEFVRDKAFAVLASSEEEFGRELGKFVSGEHNLSQMSAAARQAANLHEPSLISKSYLDVYSALLASS